jgi:ankyrin repeat protein
MKKSLFVLLLFIFFRPDANCQNDNGMDSIILELKVYIDGGGDLNAPLEYGSVYYQEYIWSFGYYGDTTELPIVRFLVAQNQKLVDLFWFKNDPSGEVRNYLFYYIQLLHDNKYDLNIDSLKDVITIFYLPNEYSEQNYINELDYYDKTPLMYAAEMGDEKLVRYLLDNGAKTKIKNSKNRKAYDFALDKKIQKLLK